MTIDIINRARRLLASFGERLTARGAATEDRQLPFFVYGTLKPGGINYTRFGLPDAIISQAPAVLERAAIYTDGTYPCLVMPDDAGDSDRVKGFVFTLDAAQYPRLLRQLDHLERYQANAPLEQSWLVRRVVTAALSTGERVEAWIYMAGPKMTKAIEEGKLTRVADGDWPIELPRLPPWARLF